MADSDSREDGANVKKAGGWYAMPHAVTDHLLTLSDSAIRVGLHLARRANREAGGSCYPPVPKIAEATGLSVSSVHRGIRDLVKANLLTVERRKTEAGDWDFNLYTIAWVVPPAEPGGATTGTRGGANGTRGGANGTGGGGATGAPITTRSETTRSENRKAADAAPLQWPSELSTPEAREAFERWIAYRKKKRQPLLPESQQALLQKWAALGTSRFIGAINHSITEGYQGLYEEKGKTNASSSYEKQFGDRGAADYGKL